MHRLLNALTFLALVVLVAAGSSGLVDTAYGQNSDIDYFRTEAELARAYAKKRRAQADQWGRRAEDAREQAKKATKTVDRESWLDDARYRQERADAAAIAADEAEALAVTAEAQLLQALQNLEKGPTDVVRPAETVRKPKNSTPAIPVNEVIGVWDIDSKDRIFVIVQENPDFANQAYKLEAHTESRVWKGWYTPFEEGHVSRMQNARVVFKYSPKFDEMNSEIPKWARQQIEGQLEWEIELNEPQSCGGPPTLDGQFFPGKVKWSEKDRSVKIDGRGEPRDLVLALRQFELEDAYVSTSIRIRPPGSGGKSDDAKTDELLPFAPLQFLVEKQLFHVDISLPYEVAKKQGEKLNIKIRGLSSGKSKPVELLRGVFRRGRPAKYTNYRPMFLGDSKPFLSQSWQNEIGDHAQGIDLDLDNGESVVIGFDKTFETVPVYKDMEEYTVAKYLQAANFLEKLHRIRLVAPGAPKADRQDAHVRLLRLKNFKILMNNAENPKWLRVLIAEEYLGPVEEASQAMYDPEKVYGAGQIRVHDLNIRESIKYFDVEWPNELSEWERNGDNDTKGRFDGIIWSNQYEFRRVIQLVGGAWRKRVREAFDTFMIDITKGLYEWALSEASVGYGRFRIGVADLFALTGDIDHYGRKLPKGKKIEIISGLILSHLLDYSTDTLRDNLLDESFGYQAPGDKLLTIKDVVKALQGRNTQRHKVKLVRPPGMSNSPDFPETLNQKQKENATPALAANSESINLKIPVSCAVAPPRAKPKSLTSSPEPDSMEIALIVAERFGVDAVIDAAQPQKLGKQEFGTCNTGAILAGAGVDMNEVAVLRLMVENDKAFAKKMKGISYEEHPFTKGYTEEEAIILTGLLGRESTTVNNGKLIPMAALRHWKEKSGWSIKMVIHADDHTDGDNKHALDIVGFKDSPDSCGMQVTVYDPGLQVRVTMPAKDLKDRLADYDVLFHRESGDHGTTKLPTKMASTDKAPPPKVGPKVPNFDPAGDDGDDVPVSKSSPFDGLYTEEDARKIVAELEPKAKDATITIAEGVKLYDAQMTLRSREQLAEDQRRRPSWITGRDMTLHDLIERMPEKDSNMPMHVTNRTSLLEMTAEGNFKIPAGASFSHGKGKTDTLREGNVAIRIREGHEGYVEFTEDNINRGLSPFYWASGKHGEGIRNTTRIPTEHLEFLKPGNGPGEEEWVRFRQKEDINP